MKKIILGVGILLFFFASPSLGFAIFTLTADHTSFSLAPLEVGEAQLTVGFNQSSNPSDEEPYILYKDVVCNEYDDSGSGNCIDSVPDLCPYISLEPRDDESTEVVDGGEGKGQLGFPGDISDVWSLKVTAPASIPESIAGKTLKCLVQISWHGQVFQVRGLTKTAYADDSSVVVEATFNGSTSSPQVNPVIIIPGIMGSAYKDGQLVIDPILHTYDDLIQTLEANGYVEGQTLFTFPYEWRDSNFLTASLLKNKIDQVKSACVNNQSLNVNSSLGNVNCNKVDLVAHSMGGLIAREYIEHGDYSSRNDVNHLIFLGTPHNGAPTDYLQWEAGEFQNSGNNTLVKLFYNAEAIENSYSNLFNYIQNRPISSVQELLPTSNYLKDKDTNSIRNYSDNYPRNIFLEALNNDTGLNNLLNSGVKITNIIGTAGSTSTVYFIRVGDSSNPLWVNGRPDGFDGQTQDRGLEMGNGDGTVTTDGATLDSSVPNQIVSAEHQRIPTVAEGKVFNILTGKTATTTFDHHYGVDTKVLIFQLFSPVDMVITAPDGKKIGKDFSSGQDVNQIPGAFYSGFNTNEEYITILNPLDGEYKVQLQGTGSGKYTVATSFVSDGSVDSPQATTTTISGTTTPGQINNVTVELDNSDPSDISADPDLIADINKSFEVGWIKDVKIKNNLLTKANNIIKFEKKVDTIPDGKNKQKRIERLNKRVDKVAARGLLVDLRGYNKDKITIDGYNLLKADLDWIIAN